MEADSAAEAVKLSNQAKDIKDQPNKDLMLQR
jgi:hypothetical protein